MSQPPVPPDRPTFASGPVTSLTQAPPSWPGAEPPDTADVISSGRTRRPRNPRQALFIYGGVAGFVLVVGVVVLLILVLNGQWGSGKGPLSQNAQQPPDVRPP